jgi:hypothetical protein
MMVPLSVYLWDGFDGVFVYCVGEGFGGAII